MGESRLQNAFVWVIEFDKQLLLVLIHSLLAVLHSAPPRWINSESETEREAEESMHEAKLHRVYCSKKH